MKVTSVLLVLSLVAIATTTQTTSTTDSSIDSSYSVYSTSTTDSSDSSYGVLSTVLSRISSSSSFSAGTCKGWTEDSGEEVSDIGPIIVTVLVVLIVIVHNPLGHERKFVNRRFVNWFIVGMTYASAYFGRYNMNVSNQTCVYEQLGLPESDGSSMFGSIITCGFVSYAVCVVLNGFMVDKIGAKWSMVIGAFGSAFFNILEGLFITFNTSTGATPIVILCILYCFNNYFQTFCTCAICKLAVYWYPKEERGYFSGIFGVVISLGFYFAFQVNGVLIYALGWASVYYLPALQLILFGVLDLLFTADTPRDAGFDLDITQGLIGAKSMENVPVASKKKFSIETIRSFHPIDFIRNLFKPKEGEDNSLKALFITVFTNPIFIILCGVDICLGWDRDGILSWYTKILTSIFGEGTASNEYSLASGGTTVGGMFGSLTAGILSDTIFRARRTPVAFLYFVILTINFGLMYFVENSWVFATLVGLSAVWLSGLNGLITSTCAMDFAGTAATGTAVGLLDGVQKIGSSLTGSPMGAIIDKWSYDGWIICLMPASILASILLLTIITRKPSDIKNAEKKLDIEKQCLISGIYSESQNEDQSDLKQSQ